MNPLESRSRGVWIHSIHLVNSLRSSKKKKKHAQEEAVDKYPWGRRHHGKQKTQKSRSYDQAEASE